MASERHKSVPFSPTQWREKTAGMPRIMSSVFFDICVYNWDKAAPMPLPLLRLLISDIPSEQANWIITSLEDLEAVQIGEETIVAPFALEAGQAAYALWAAKSAGGRKTAGKAKKATARRRAAPAPVEAPPPDNSDEIAEGKIKQAKAEAASAAQARLKNCRMAMQTWNEMAVKHAFPQVEKVTEARQIAVAKSVADSSIARLLETIQNAPRLVKPGTSFDSYLAEMLSVSGWAA